VQIHTDASVQSANNHTDAIAAAALLTIDLTGAKTIVCLYSMS
jgi:hypothetical protein